MNHQNVWQGFSLGIHTIEMRVTDDTLENTTSPKPPDAGHGSEFCSIAVIKSPTNQMFMTHQIW